MKSVNRLYRYFSLEERLLWSCSMLLILLSFFLFDRGSLLSLAASLVGATSLIFCAKGNPVGQVLMILFSILYSIISFSFSYYGELITYLGMTLPMAVVAFVSWLRHPYQGNKAEVTVNHLKGKEIVLLFGLTVVVTAIFLGILAYFDTANLIVSTFSVMIRTRASFF